MAYFTRRRAEGLTDRDIMRCLKRHLANEVYAALCNPSAPPPAGPELRARRCQQGISMPDLATILDAPYRRLQCLETGARADPALEHQVTAVLDLLDTRIRA